MPINVKFQKLMIKKAKSRQNKNWIPVWAPKIRYPKKFMTFISLLLLKLHFFISNQFISNYTLNGTLLGNLNGTLLGNLNGNC